MSSNRTAQTHMLTKVSLHIFAFDVLLFIYFRIIYSVCMHRQNLQYFHAFKIQRNGWVNRQISRKLQFLFPLKTIWNNSRVIFYLKWTISDVVVICMFIDFLLLFPCMQCLSYGRMVVFFIRNRFPRIRCSKCKQIVYKSSEKKPIPNYILWQILKHYTLIHMITVLKSLLTWKNFAFSCHVHWCCIYLYLEYHSYVVAVLFFW